MDFVDVQVMKIGLQQSLYPFPNTDGSTSVYQFINTEGDIITGDTATLNILNDPLSERFVDPTDPIDIIVIDLMNLCTIDVHNLGSDDNDLGIYNIDNINQDVDCDNYGGYKENAHLIRKPNDSSQNNIEYCCKT